MMIAIEGRYLAGEQLPNQTSLPQQLQVSRTTLREAMRVLVAQGVVETYSRQRDVRRERFLPGR